VVSKAGLTSDEARRRLAKSGPNALPDTSAHPIRKIGNLTIAGVIMGIGDLLFCTGVLVFGVYRMGFTVGALQTLAFVVIVFGNQATTYTNRERRHLWSSCPSIWLLTASVADLLIASTLAVGGFAMTPLPAWVVAGALVAAAAFAIILDFVKVPVFRRLSIT
jgi:H+-transporting ATPase